MLLRRFATLPTAFASGVVGSLGYPMLNRWAAAHKIASTRTSDLAVYGVMVVAPFLFFVVGLDTRRWDGNYWFTHEGKADFRRMWVRWGIYFVGVMIGYSIS